MKMKKVLENQGLFLAEKERFELSRRYNRPTPLAGAPLRPLEYFSVYSSQSAVAWDLRHTILYTFFIFLSSPFLLFLKKDHDYCIQGLQMTKKPRSQHKICRYKHTTGDISPPVAFLFGISLAPKAPHSVFLCSDTVFGIAVASAVVRGTSAVVAAV